ncbi:MAG: phosphoribosyltransferase domain-containing protein [Candidatus Competibacteraceae bacterium]|nr:phosphoribosyltransferase domain-containing protein [Candidatus Competibacteraceae bacterium]
MTADHLKAIAARPRSVAAPIRAGRLRLDIRREELPLEDCLAYATRQNPRRLYLFVSKVLGKHWPVKPSVMRDTHRRLAAKIAALPGPLLVIGVAETATALGRGVAEEAALHAGRDDIGYLQTTRYLLSHHLAFGFDESHSHAPDHAVYWPVPALRPLFRSARTLVLVDDEISTGRTLLELARAYLRLNPGTERVALACITNWLSEARRRELSEALDRPLLCPCLIEGGFQFEPDPDFPAPELPPAIAHAARRHDAIAADPARTGVLAGRWQAPPPEFPPVPAGRPLAVIGTGEYAYTPYRLALALEGQGFDVRFQTTTRSPVLLGDAILSRREFADHCGDGIPNYLYNLDPQRFPLVCYEHPAMLATHSLAGDIGGLAWVTEPRCPAS